MPKKRRGQSPNKQLWTMPNIAWAAGFIDGEGSIGVYKSTHSFTACVQATQNDPELLNRLLEIFGGLVDYNKNRHIYRWRLNNRNFIYPMIRELYSWFSRKRQKECQNVFDWYENVKPHWNTRKIDD
ncbi:MAG: LAGLIDADG family homing endonuclease [Candidatus Berkelbacteria bacterium]|nr:LAGLIDADG family homing endonuclease [Candidatus Berkelbacteria bacterium]